MGGSPDVGGVDPTVMMNFEKKKAMGRSTALAQTSLARTAAFGQNSTVLAGAPRQTLADVSGEFTENSFGDKDNKALKAGYGYGSDKVQRKAYRKESLAGAQQLQRDQQYILSRRNGQ